MDKKILAREYLKWNRSSVIIVYQIGKKDPYIPESVWRVRVDFFCAQIVISS